MALVLTGNLKLGADGGSAVELGDEVTQFKLTATVDTVEVPATLGGVAHGRGGGVDYAITIGYLSNDIASSLFTALYDALVGAGTLFFVGSMRSDVVSASNPRWCGTLVVTEATVGAAAEALSTGSATFPLTGAPTKEVA